MGLISTGSVERARNFSKAESKCMNCQVFFVPGRGVYERRFCSEKCREEYFL